MVKTIAYLGLGSNLGDRKKNILEAAALLKLNGIQILKISSIIETDPVGYEKQNKFLNAALKVSTCLAPEKLLELCKKCEKIIGRKKTFRFGPRKIDIDILLFGQKFVNKKKLKIPHPRMHKRSFVLRPLCEIAPKTKIPGINRSVCRVLKELENKSSSF